MKFNNKFYIALLILGLIIVAGCSQAKKTDVSTVSNSNGQVTIFKSPGCGCCNVYSQYMGRKGFDVKVVDTDNLSPVKSQYNIPSSMQSCHTTVIGNYFVEGHVPVEAIEKLMEEKPDIAGIAMPGMPSGSPGMTGAKKGAFVVYAVHKDGSTSEFMRI